METKLSVTSQLLLLIHSFQLKHNIHTYPIFIAAAELLTTNKLSELACLALYLMYEKKQGKDSVWYPYIKELDRQRGRGQLAVESPLLWSESELNYLTGSPVKVYMFIFSISKQTRVYLKQNLPHKGTKVFHQLRALLRLYIYISG